MFKLHIEKRLFPGECYEGSELGFLVEFLLG